MLGDWPKWDTIICSDECGGGTRSRTRDIVSEAEFGASACPSLEDRTQTEDCNMEPCECSD